MRVEPGPIPSAVPAAGAGAVDVVWTSFRPLFRLEGRTPEQRSEAHRVNVAHRKLDLADFEAFLRRHGEAARTCRTVDALLAHGRPVLPSSPKEAYATRSERGDLDALDARFVHALTDALAELDGIRARLEGRRRPLDVRVDASLALKARVGGREYGVEASLPDRTAAASLGGAGAAARCALGPAGEVRCGVVVAGISASGGEVDSIELKVAGAYGRLGAGAVAAGVAAGREVGGEALALRAEAKVGLDVKLLDAETVRRAFSPEDSWRRTK